MLIVPLHFHQDINFLKKFPIGQLSAVRFCDSETDQSALVKNARQALLIFLFSIMQDFEFFNY